jgi:hypothetical protein
METKEVKSLIQIVSGTIVGLALAATVNYYCPEMFVPGPKFEHASKLLVNTNDSVRFLVNETEEAGLEDLRQQVVSSELEEAHAYLPDRELWVEIGTEQTLDIFNDISNSCRLDQNLLDRLYSENERVILYHFHPSVISLFKSMKSAEPDKVRNWDAKEGSFAKESYNSRFYDRLALHAVPSIADVIAFVCQARKFRELKPGSKLENKICSYYGITEIRITDEGEKFFFSAPIMVSLPYAQNVMLRPDKNKSPEVYNDETALRRAAELVGNLNDKLISFSFKPYGDQNPVPQPF